MKTTFKKALSALIACAMLLSIMIVGTIPTAAVDGMWDALGTAVEYDEDFSGTPRSRPGYEYTEDGLHMIPAKWEGHQTPYGTLQTKDTVDLKDGVYMLVRVDNFTYEGEKWFNFSLWDRAGISPGSTEHGEGAQCHIRPGNAKNVGGVDWYTGGFTNVGQTVIPKTAYSLDDEGRVILALTVKWENNTYSMNVNGAPAPDTVIEFMNEKWGGVDSAAYVGFSLQNSNKNGTVEATILKFGTSEATAETPVGDDRKEPEEFNHTPAALEDASTIPAGKPAVLMNANVIESHILAKPISLVGANITVNDDYSARVVVNKATADAGEWKVKYNVSYSVEDFPVCAILVRNLCTCRDEVCYANESCHLYLCTGEAIQPAPENLIKFLDISEPITVGDDTYLMFYIDVSDEYAPIEASGRINSARVDFEDIDNDTPGKNAFDVCWIAFFRTPDEASTYVKESLNVTDVEDPSETDPDKSPEDTETAEKVNDGTTEGNEAVETEPKNQDNGNDTSAAKGGCNSAIGLGTVLLLTLASAAGAISFKKKED
jgi:hypothetical protein